MPLIYIDGTMIEAQQGQSIIEVAQKNGISIPHFCWHPALSVAGNCRTCLVTVGMQKKDQEGALQFDEAGQPVVNWMPKLQIACATPIADGMFVDTTGKRTIEAQEAVMEFILINHPLDCPICDEAGQCKLQEYAFTHSVAKSRFDEEKVHKPKRVEFGPNVMFDGERCIMCSRCIRFADEVAQQPALTFVQRGDSVTIRTFPGTTFDNPYSMNVIDICPVGALTSIDFRFRARVWEMSFTDTICTGCARGCNISLGVMNNEVLRVEPRTNPHVNKYWMCDHGRLTTPALVNENRVSEPLVRVDGQLQSTTWDRAITAATEILHSTAPSKIMVLGSAKASNEDNYALARLAREVLKTHNVDMFKHVDATFGDEMLKVNEVAPNAIGAHAVGIAAGDGGVTVDHLEAQIKKGAITAVILMADSAEHHSDGLSAALASLENLIVLSSHMTATAASAAVVLPLSTFAELEGTFTNVSHRVQHVKPGIVTADNERYMGMKMSRWDKFGAPNDRWSQGSRRDCRPGWQIIQHLANGLGAGWSFKNSTEVFDHLAEHVKAFHGLSYEGMDRYLGQMLNGGGSESVEPEVYVSYIMRPQ